MLAIGGQAPKAVRSVECYSFKEDRWTHLSDMPVRRCRCGVAVVQVKDFFFKFHFYSEILCIK